MDFLPIAPAGRRTVVIHSGTLSFLYFVFALAEGKNEIQMKAGAPRCRRQKALQWTGADCDSALAILQHSSES
jgi:hypothetical protein